MRGGDEVGDEVGDAAASRAAGKHPLVRIVVRKDIPWCFWSSRCVPSKKQIMINYGLWLYAARKAPASSRKIRFDDEAEDDSMPALNECEVCRCEPVSESVALV